MGFFLAQWINFERAAREIVKRKGGGQLDKGRLALVPSTKMLNLLGVLDDDIRWEVERIRRVRNNLVHGVEIPAPSDLQEDGERLQTIVARLNDMP
jgi:hypothetical protein